MVVNVREGMKDGSEVRGKSWVIDGYECKRGGRMEVGVGVAVEGKGW